ncbi:MAG: hypothetical protein SNG27_07770 [Rikenellaceae bacterium]
MKKDRSQARRGCGRGKKSGIYKVFTAFVMMIVLSLLSPTDVEASESTDPLLVESVNLAVMFKNGARTVRKGSKGLQELYYYNSELIDYLILRVGSSMSSKISGTDSISVVLDYVKAGDFTARFPYGMERMQKGASKERLHATEDGIVLTFKDGTTKIFEGADITMLKGIDPETIKSMDMVSAQDLNRIVEIRPIEAPAKEEVVVPATPKIPTPIISVEPVERVDYYELSRAQTTVIENGNYVNGDVIAAYRRDGYTEVDIVGTIFYSKQWFGFSSETFLVDPITFKRYPIKGVAKDIPLDRYVRVIDQVGRTVIFTLIFPPLPIGIDNVNLLGYRIKDQPIPALASERNAYIDKNVLVSGDVEREYREIFDNEISDK